MIKKNTYETPESKLFVVRIEGNFMASDFETQQLKQGNTNWWDDGEDD